LFVSISYEVVVEFEFLSPREQVSQVVHLLNEVGEFQSPVRVDDAVFIFLFLFLGSFRFLLLSSERLFSLGVYDCGLHIIPDGVVVSE